jgi:hypothetical protein
MRLRGAVGAATRDDWLRVGAEDGHDTHDLNPSSAPTSGVGALVVVGRPDVGNVAVRDGRRLPTPLPNSAIPHGAHAHHRVGSSDRSPGNIDLQRPHRRGNGGPDTIVGTSAGSERSAELGTDRIRVADDMVTTDSSFAVAREEASGPRVRWQPSRPSS